MHAAAALEHVGLLAAAASGPVVPSVVAGRTVNLTLAGSGGEGGAAAAAVGVVQASRL